MLTPEEKVKAAEAINFLLNLVIKEGVQQGLEQDWDGGSIGSDLRYLAEHFGLTQKR